MQSARGCQKNQSGPASKPNRWTGCLWDWTIRKFPAPITVVAQASATPATTSTWSISCKPLDLPTIAVIAASVMSLSASPQDLLPPHKQPLSTNRPSKGPERMEEAWMCSCEAPNRSCMEWSFSIPWKMIGHLGHWGMCDTTNVPMVSFSMGGLSSSISMMENKSSHFETTSCYWLMWWTTASFVLFKQQLNLHKMSMMNHWVELMPYSSAYSLSFGWDGLTDNVIHSIPLKFRM